MIITVHTFEVKQDKSSEALEFCKKIQSYDKKQPEVEDSVVMTPLQGKSNRIVLSARYSSLAVLEEYRKKYPKDPERQALMKEGPEYFIPGSHEVYLYQVE